MRPFFDSPAGRIAVITLALAGLTSCAHIPTETAETVLRRAELAMGSITLGSISFAGSGTGATFGQAFVPGTAWPKINYSSFSRVADYQAGAFREDAARSRAEPNGGGAVPLMGLGEQRTTGLLRGAHAWNMVGPAPIPAPLTLSGRTHDLWTTPHGVLKAALANQPSIRMRSDGERMLSAISFTVPGRFSATVLISPAGMVEKIESTQPNPVLGDTASVITFSDYQVFNGVKFPLRIQQAMGGHPILDLAVTEVKTNVVVGIEVPALVSAATERVVVEKAAEGVWFIAGGSHNSVAIEMKDHMILVEAPLYDGRTGPVLDEVKKLGNGKPLRYAINSHHHFDHSGGLRTTVSQGAIVVTNAQAKPFFEQAFANPNRISPDALQGSGRSATVLGVSSKHTFSDGERTVEVHNIDASVHAQGFLMVYLPKEKILVQADAYTPGPPNTPAPARPNDLHVNLVQNIERLNLQVNSILPLHGRMVPLSELHQAIGRKS